MVACRRQDLLNKTPKYLYANCRLCSEHFEDCMFVNPETINRLNDMAKPSLFKVNNPPPKVGCKRRIIEKKDEAVEFEGKFTYVRGYTC